MKQANVIAIATTMMPLTIVRSNPVTKELDSMKLSCTFSDIVSSHARCSVLPDEPRRSMGLLSLPS